MIRTVLGDIEAAELGVCYAHEHVIIDRSYTTERYPEFRIDSVANACRELEAFHRAGGRAMIDSMPCDSGRNVLKLAEISRRTGVHIMAPTGLHLPQYYPEGHWGGRLSIDELADLFIADIEGGIDANDYGGPQVERTPHRAGIIKIASGLNEIDDRASRIFEAAAMAHRRTGAPILTHTEQGTAALEQVELLARLGVPLEHVVLSHTDRRPDAGYHRDILASGVRVEYDSAFRWKSEAANPTLQLVVEMFKAGFGSQILLGMDAARRSYWRSYGGAPGLNYLLETFVPMLHAAGLTGRDVGTIFVDNPANAYTFATK